MLVPPVSHILEFAYMALLTDLSNSFYLDSKLPALSSTFDGNRGIICERKSILSLNIAFSKRNKDLND